MGRIDVFQDVSGWWIGLHFQRGQCLENMISFF